jgi:hypothetical protein
MREVVTRGHLDHDRAQPTPIRGQAERSCHRGLSDTALAGNDEQRVSEQIIHRTWT